MEHHVEVAIYGSGFGGQTSENGETDSKWKIAWKLGLGRDKQGTEEG